MQHRVVLGRLVVDLGHVDVGGDQRGEHEDPLHRAAVECRVTQWTAAGGGVVPRAEGRRRRPHSESFVRNAKAAKYATLYCHSYPLLLPHSHNSILQLESIQFLINTRIAGSSNLLCKLQAPLKPICCIYIIAAQVIQTGS
jgi:hypothetical protein